MSSTMVAGRTRWLTTGAVGALASFAAVGVAVAMGQGLLAASFLIGGVPVQLTVPTAEVDGLGLAASTEATSVGDAKVLVVTGERVDVDGLCATLDVQPPIGPGFTVIATATQGRKIDLVIDAERFAGDAHAERIIIGRDAASLTRGLVDGPPGGAGLQADTFILTGGTADALAVEARSFALDGLDVSIRAAGTRC